MNKVRVFAYGSLKREQGLHIVLRKANAKYIGYDTLSGPWCMIDMGAFPALIEAQHCDNTIRGEVWEVDDEGLAAIDQAEGHPRFFRRTKEWTDKNVRAWVYSFPDDEIGANAEDVITGGLWRPNPAELAYWKSNGYDEA